MTDHAAEPSTETVTEEAQAIQEMFNERPVAPINPKVVAAAGGAAVAAAAVVVLSWGLAQAGVVLPQNVQDALIILLPAALAFASGWFKRGPA